MKTRVLAKTLVDGAEVSVDVSEVLELLIIEKNILTFVSYNNEFIEFMKTIETIDVIAPKDDGGKVISKKVDLYFVDKPINDTSKTYLRFNLTD